MNKNKHAFVLTLGFQLEGMQPDELISLKLEIYRIARKMKISLINVSGGTNSQAGMVDEVSSRLFQMSGVMPEESESVTILTMKMICNSSRSAGVFMRKCTSMAEVFTSIVGVNFSLTEYFNMIQK
jgi:hypothetical protein